jgi:integrase
VKRNLADLQEAMRMRANMASIDSTGRKGKSVPRRRFQRGYIKKNDAGTIWLGQFSEYVLVDGVEKRKRKQVVLGVVFKPDGVKMTYTEAKRAFEPYLKRANDSALSAPIQEQKRATLKRFVEEVFERDYVPMFKPSTKAGIKGHLARLVSALGDRDMREIRTGDIQRIVTAMVQEGKQAKIGRPSRVYAPKTVRNFWGTVSLLWNAALAHEVVGSMLVRPKLPKNTRKEPPFFTLAEVGRIISSFEGELRALFSLAAETGLRAGEIAGLRLTDVSQDRITLDQSVWRGVAQEPKTQNAKRQIAISPWLADMLQEQIERQRAKNRELVFTTSNGTPLDMNMLQKRKLVPLLAGLEIRRAGLHAFRHFNVSLQEALRIPLMTISERVGHAVVKGFTLSVYGHQLDSTENAQAALRLGQEIARAVEDSDDTRTIRAANENGLQSCQLEAAVA